MSLCIACGVHGITASPFSAYGVRCLGAAGYAITSVKTGIREKKCHSAQIGWLSKSSCSPDGANASRYVYGANASRCRYVSVSTRPVHRTFKRVRFCNVADRFVTPGQLLHSYVACGHALHAELVLDLSREQLSCSSCDVFMSCPFALPYGDVVVSLPDGSTVVSLPDGLAVVRYPAVR